MYHGGWNLELANCKVTATWIRTVPSTGPAGVDEPPGGAIRLHLLGEHGGVLGRVEHDERRAEASGEGRLWLLDAVLCTGNLQSRWQYQIDIP
jgi:hypothetical protein